MYIYRPPKGVLRIQSLADAPVAPAVGSLVAPQQQLRSLAPLQRGRPDLQGS